MPAAQTYIRTDRASRYLAQLCEHLDHLGRNPPRHAGAGHGPQMQRVESTERHGVIEFPFGSCELAAADDGLTIRLTADDADGMQHLQEMFKVRLETIGRRDGLVVDW